MSLNELKNQIKNGDFSPLYLFTGEEHYLRRHYLSLIKKKLVPDSADFDLSVFDGKTLTVDELSEAVSSYPFMAEKRLIIIRDMSLAKSNPLTAFLSKLEDNDGSVIIVSMETDPPLAASAEVKRFVSETKADLCVFSPLSETEICDWIVRKCASENKKISRADASYLLSISPASLDMIKNDCDILISHCIRDTVTRADIDEMIVPTADSKAWQLTEAVVSGKTAEAFGIIDELYKMRLDDTVIASSVYRAVTELLAVKLGQMSGKDAAKIAAVSGMRDFVVRKYLPLCNRLTLDFLSQCLDICSSCDIDIKSKMTDKRARIETAVGKMAELRK